VEMPRDSIKLESSPEDMAFLTSWLRNAEENGAGTPHPGSLAESL